MLDFSSHKLSDLSIMLGLTVFEAVDDQISSSGLYLSKEYDDYLKENVLSKLFKVIDNTIAPFTLATMDGLTFIQMKTPQKAFIGPFFCSSEEKRQYLKIAEAKNSPLLSEGGKNLQIRNRRICYLIQRAYPEEPIDHQEISSSARPALMVGEKRDSNLAISFSYDAQRRIMDGIRTGKADYVISILAELDDRKLLMEKDIEYGLEKGIQYAYTLNTLCRIAAEEVGVPVLQLHSISRNIAEKLEACTSIEERKYVGFTMVRAYCKAVNDQSMLNYSRSVYKTRKYVLEHLNEEISLDILAQNSGVNPSYLSRQFKKECQVTIVDFITKQRIKEAKWILETKEIPIIEVAEAVGFKSHSYFSRVFLKYEGITPQDYKLRHKP